MNERYDRTAALLRDSVTERIFPGAVAEVGSSRGIEWTFATGHQTFDADAAVTDSSTLFDLASLTKPLATTSVALWLVAEQRLRLDDEVSRYCAEWTGADRASVTIRQLLEHASGLSARLSEPPPSTAAAFVHAICTMALERAPGTAAIYSDLGFILLGFCLERVGGRALASLATDVFASLCDVTPRRDNGQLFSRVPPDALARTAPTSPLAEDAQRRHRLCGEVHDNYAAALGGFSGHAGLFGTASGVGAVAQLILESVRGKTHRSPFTPESVTQMMTPSRVPGSSRAIGWDTMRPTSSCGRFMSTDAIGHVGFTGTSVWVEPSTDRYFVLLTNRVCDGGSSDDMQRVRRAFHELLTAP